MYEQRQRMLQILRSNRGFKNPDQWVDYALLHNFRHVEAEKLKACPDCAESHNDILGQYVYYSTLVQLRACKNCGLIFSDARSDPKVVFSHFEQAYKDEDYFARLRRDIFWQLADLIDTYAGPGANVLDIGGAKGHLLTMVKQRRPDLNLVLNDVSQVACEFAETQYGLKTVCGAVDALERLPSSFDVVVLSDVIYYEPELSRLWAFLSRIVNDSGTIMIRVPNKHVLIKATSRARKIFGGQQALDMQDRIWFFNPEHLYLLSRTYLGRRLRQIGFSNVNAIPSALLVGDGEARSQFRIYYQLAKMVFFCTFRRIILTPSMIIIARR
jgi:2-polyprenyl-3-methyl-5-hydroxy-6-metoxy-1,4-benzoquinol methylase